MKFVEAAADLLSPSEMLSMSGLEFITGILDGRYPAPPICRTLNYQMVEAETGKVVFRGTPNFGSLNPLGTVHGGWFGTLLDSCMACAVQTHLPTGSAYTTLEYKINILRPLLHDDEDVLAIGTSVHVGRKTGVAEGRIVGTEDGRTYATGSTTCIILDS
ncbi:PaaI family thioesterase [Algicella marina]|uniref:Hotdog fold thioesterase n=1 Tax=Algicella marina TaxID=2683284 RepID=A0A6P1SXW2_9RHOB|nr:PaaI family thioesterase [Algicella marina]QHQ33829.1 hotdog fold thioesterase [Algicella marina]